VAAHHRTCRPRGDDAEVNVDTGLRAAEKLQAVLDKRNQGDDILQMRPQVYRIQDAVKAVVPQEMWGAIADKLDEPQQHHDALDVETDDHDDDDDGYGPAQCGEDEDDEF
jgi:hypothetical protein